MTCSIGIGLTSLEKAQWVGIESDQREEGNGEAVTMLCLLELKSIHQDCWHRVVIHHLRPIASHVWLPHSPTEDLLPRVLMKGLDDGREWQRIRSYGAVPNSGGRMVSGMSRLTPADSDGELSPTAYTIKQSSCPMPFSTPLWTLGCHYQSA